MHHLLPSVFSKSLRVSAVVLVSALTAVAAFGQAPVRKWNEIVGKRIMDAQGNEVGVIADTAVDLERGRFFGLIVSYGGFLGIGANERIVPPGALSDRGVPNSLQLNMNESALRAAPIMRLSRGFGPPDTQKAAALYRYYGQKPYFSTEIASAPVGDEDLGQLGYVTRGTKILLMPVENLQGKPIGVVRSLWDLDSATGRFSGVVITPTAFDAAGGRKIVPPQALRFNPRKNALRISNRKESFSAAPQFAFLPGGQYVADEPMRPGIPRPPLVQGNSKRDKQTTKRIYDEILGNGGLSQYAKNVRVASVKGTVTVRGRVENATERSQILAYAAEAAGNGRVLDEIEVKPMTRFDRSIDADLE